MNSFLWNFGSVCWLGGIRFSFNSSVAGAAIALELLGVEHITRGFAAGTVSSTMGFGKNIFGIVAIRISQIGAIS